MSSFVSLFFSNWNYDTRSTCILQHSLVTWILKICSTIIHRKYFRKYKHYDKVKRIFSHSMTLDLPDVCTIQCFTMCNILQYWKHG